MCEILFKGFHKNENGKQKVFVNGEWIKGEWVEGNIIGDSVIVPKGQTFEIEGNEAIKPYIYDTRDSSYTYKKPLLELNVYGTSDLSVNEALKKVRRKYWNPSIAPLTNFELINSLNLAATIPILSSFCGTTFPSNVFMFVSFLNYQS